MADLPRLSLEELLLEFELHPNRRHLYVESDDDASLLDFLISSCGGSVKVYCIDGIDIQGDTLSIEGNRGRVIMLARELATRFETLAELPYVRCFADADFDCLLDTSLDHGKFLTLTDFSSTEMYTFSKRVLEDVVTKGCGLHRIDLDSLVESLQETLTGLFVLRATNICLAWGMPWVSPCKNHLKATEAGVTLDEDGLLGDYLRRGGKWRERGTFGTELMRLRGKGAGDPRHTMRGHDFVEVLAWFLRSQVRGKGAGGLTEAVTWKLLRTALRLDDVVLHANLASLIATYGGTSP